MRIAVASSANTIQAIATPLSAQTASDSVQRNAQAANLTKILNDRRSVDRLTDVLHDAGKDYADVLSGPDDLHIAIAMDATGLLGTAFSTGDKVDIGVGSVNLVADIVEQSTSHLQYGRYIKVLTTVVRFSAPAVKAWLRYKHTHPEHDPLETHLLRAYTRQLGEPDAGPTNVTYRNLPVLSVAGPPAAES